MWLLVDCRLRLVESGISFGFRTQRFNTKGWLCKLQIYLWFQLKTKIHGFRDIWRKSKKYTILKQCEIVIKNQDSE